MELTFLRISCILLIVACAILAVDKSATGYKMQNVASRIAEKTEIIKENEKRYKADLAALQAVAAEKERRIYFRTPEDHSDKTKLPQREQKLIPRTREAKQAKQLVRQVHTQDPAKLIKDTTGLWTEKKQSVVNDCVIHPETGLVTYPPAAVLEEVARKNALKAATSFVWDMKNFRLGCVTNIKSAGKLAKRPAAHHKWTLPVHPDVVQSENSSVIFPFAAADTHKKREITFLPAKSGVPVGGVYVHYFRLTGEHGFQLDYELPAEAADDDFRAGIKLFPLVCGHVSMVQNNRVRSFRFMPKNGEMTFLVVAERAFFPVSITGMTLYRETPIAAEATSNASPRRVRSAK